MFNLNSILVFSEKPDELVSFYKKIIGKDPDWSGGDFSGFKIGSGFLTIGPHDKIHGRNKSPERIMLNLETSDVEEEFHRLKNMGLKVIAKPYHPGEDTDMTIATFEDSDGNYFQILTPMDEKN